jgi:hypothetical protein
METALPKASGERVFFRLSDVKGSIRQRVAQRLTDQALQSLEFVEDALYEAMILRAVADDPVTAAVEFPGECSNALRSVSREEWERVMGSTR